MTLEEAILEIRQRDVGLLTIQQAAKLVNPEGEVSARRLRGLLRQYGVEVVPGEPELVPLCSIRSLISRLAQGRGKEPRGVDSHIPKVR